MILSLSAEIEALAFAIDPAIVDYAGLGPVFTTTTKPDHKPAFGFQGLLRLVKACPVPAVAIGRLNSDHVRDVFANGTDGLAVVSAICGTSNPEFSARRISENIRESRA